MDYLLTIDGGGTKTDVAVATLTGQVIAKLRVGGTSLSHHSQAVVSDTLAAACKQFPALLAHCRAVCAGFASAGVAANAAWYRRMLGELLPAAAIEVTTDADLALEGATNAAIRTQCGPAPATDRGATATQCDPALPAPAQRTP